MNDEQERQLLHTRLNLETSQIAWEELQRFFAGGHVVVVSNELDLVDVAARVSIDDKTSIEQWINEGRIVRANDEHALAWSASNPLLWTVVARPWVLVQERKPEPGKSVH